MARSSKTENKKNSLEESMNAKYGKGALFKPTSRDHTTYNPDEFYNSGLLTLNYTLTGDYRYAFPRGRVVEIYGPEMSAKTTILLTLIAKENKNGNEAAFLDVEHGLSLDYAIKGIGVNPDMFYFAQPPCGEIAFEMIEDLVKKKIPIIGVDSVASLVPRAEIEGSMDDQHMGLHARLMGHGLRKLTSLLTRYPYSTVIFINQIRSKIGQYGNPETTTGGRAMKFYSWIRIESRSPRGGKIEEKQAKTFEEEIEDQNETEEETGMKSFKGRNKKSKKSKKKSSKVEIGSIINIKVTKNKTYMPWKTCSLNIEYGKGFDKTEDILNVLLLTDVIKLIKVPRKQNKYKFGNYNELTRDKFVEKMKKDKEFKAKLKDALNEKMEAKQDV